MIIDTISYRNNSQSETIQTYTGDWSVVEGGIVLLATVRSQVFVPWHNVERIEQIGIEDRENSPKYRYNKILTQRMRRT